jgi:chemotaxis protein methyltransferase CheR
VAAECDARSGSNASGVRPITERQFRQFRELIEREVGIHLSPPKKALLVGRLQRRLNELELRTFSEYFERVSEDPAELVRMVDRISTNETHFFREPRQFQFLKEQVFPRWLTEAAAGRRPRRVRAWSAACSTGEEPFTLGMLLLERFPPESGWELEILASDISTRVLERAATATWPVEKAGEIPRTYLTQFMLRGTRSQTGMMRAVPALRSLIGFRRINLSAASYPVHGPFDLVLCRNVLIYFEPGLKRRVVESLIDVVGPGGYLLLGHAESLSGLSDRARSAGPTVYERVPSIPGRVARPALV